MDRRGIFSTFLIVLEGILKQEVEELREDKLSLQTKTFRLHHTATMCCAYEYIFAEFGARFENIQKEKKWETPSLRKENSNVFI